LERGNAVPEKRTAELDVCLQCCRPNPAGYHFCDFCNAPLSSAAATLPAWRPWAHGFAVRRAVRQVDSWFVLAGLWFIFAPQVFLFLGMALPGSTWELCRHAIHTDGLLVGLLTTLFLLLLVGAVSALYIAILFAATRNFLRRRSRAR
jgi:hypothetical protein